jgi:transcriptional regulator with XRE-family HTH domain
MSSLRKRNSAPARRARVRKPRSGIDADAVIQSVGTNCATYRAERGLSLDALAKLSGISKGMLVEIEQRRTNPSIATLCRMANALGVGLAELLNEKPAGAQVVRHGAGIGQEFWRTVGGSRAALIDASRVRDVGGELWRWTLAAGERFDAPPHPHGTHEFIFVQRGSLVVEVGGERTDCTARGALRIRTDMPHSYLNATKTPCDFLMFVMEPISN